MSSNAHDDKAPSLAPPGPEMKFSRLIKLLMWPTSAAPYLIGVLFIWFPLRRVYFDPFLERAAYFAALFVVWHVLLWMMFRWLTSPGRDSSTPEVRASTGPQRSGKARASRNPGLAISSVVATLCFLLLLQFYRIRLEDAHFYVALFALGAIALQRSYVARRQVIPSLAARFVAVSSTSYLSFLIVDPIFKWEPLLPAAALALAFVGRDIGQHLENIRPTCVTIPGTLSSSAYLVAARGLVVSFILAPTLVASLCYLGKLSTNFIFLFGIFPLLLPLAESLRSGEKERIPPENVGFRSTVIFVAYVAILTGAGLLGRIVG